MKNMFSFVQKVFCILTADPISPAYSAVNMTTLFVARCWVLMKSQEQQILLSSATDNSNLWRDVGAYKIPDPKKELQQQQTLLRLATNRTTSSVERCWRIMKFQE
jgi:hypothetical protein